MKRQKQEGSDNIQIIGRDVCIEQKTTTTMDDKTYKAGLWNAMCDFAFRSHLVAATSEWEAKVDSNIGLKNLKQFFIDNKIAWCERGTGTSLEHFRTLQDRLNKCRP